MSSRRCLFTAVLVAVSACSSRSTTIENPPTRPHAVELADGADLDSDGDGVRGAPDRCPREAEDCDGIHDDDGCPETDGDGDRVPDVCDHCPGEPGIDDAQHPYGRGCPFIDAFVSASDFLVGATVAFAKGDATLSKDRLAALGDLAEKMKAQARPNYFVIGHASADEPRPDELAAARAAAVRDALVRLGVDGARLTVHAAGKSHPAYDSVTSALSPEKSRRVDFDVTHDHARDRAWVESSKSVQYVLPADLPCDAPPPPGPCKPRQ